MAKLSELLTDPDPRKWPKVRNSDRAGGHWVQFLHFCKKTEKFIGFTFDDSDLIASDSWINWELYEEPKEEIKVKDFSKYTMRIYARCKCGHVAMSGVTFKQMAELGDWENLRKAIESACSSLDSYGDSEKCEGCWQSLAKEETKPKEAPELPYEEQNKCYPSSGIHNFDLGEEFCCCVEYDRNGPRPFRPKPKIKRWLWSVKDRRFINQQKLDDQFSSEEEIEFINTPHVKLLWSETEFDE